MSQVGQRRRRRTPKHRPHKPRRLSPEEIERRASLVPEIRYPEELPVSRRRDDIAAAIRDHQVVVVAGETGSGKTTQLPKICLELGRGVSGRIGHTQPRRIAARSVAERIAEELGSAPKEPGSVVGYQMRFTDHTSRNTLVKVMTDGILLTEMQHDRSLSAYDTIIIDEAHERSLNIDFILGYLKQLLPRRPDLKVIITSATIDPKRFAAHFADKAGNPAPIVEVSGRTYPVEVRYRPLVEELTTDVDAEGEVLIRDQTEAIVDAVTELSREGPGDILVFLPGEREIRDTAEALEKGLAKLDRRMDKLDRRSGLEVLPLYARLSSREQHRVFEPHTGRRVVLATNVAETSLTVPGVRYVVDTGLARISRYSVRTKVQRLPIEPISKASARQRAGRCGRVEAGVCIRLYSEEDFEARPEFTDPEILRTNLASVILAMTALGLGDVARFPFVDPPDSRNVKAGVQLLEELGALVSTGSTGGGDGSRRLTKLGRTLVGIPIDPRLARMAVESDRLGCLREVLVLVAALSIQDPRERPADQQAQADQAHARFKDASSDFLTLLNLWRHVRAQQKELSSSAFRRMCRREFLNYLRIREWQELDAQLRRVAKQLGLEPGRFAETPDEDAMHKALLSGLLSHVGMRDVEKDSGRRSGGYLGARGARFWIFPGSGLFKKQPSFVMAAELVETSKLYARTNAAIQPEWAEQLGAHLVKRSYSEPHWSKKRVAVMARERVTLYGVPLAADRLVGYGKVDPQLSRELFIRHALVYGEWDARHRFLADNRALLERVEELEHRARRRDILVDEETLFDFYDARVGAEVVSGGHFDGWWKKVRREHPDLLAFDPAMLVNETAEQVSEADYPDHWREGDLALDLSYRFEPGAPEDGVSVDVPVGSLNLVDAAAFSWQVPGLRGDLVMALLRSLPKRLRVSFVPAPNVARDFLASTPAGEEPLLAALERFLRATTGVVVPREAWDWSKVPEHLRPTFRVIDEHGGMVAEGKDLDELRAPLRPAFDQALTDAAVDLTATGRTTWAFGTIEPEFTRTRAGHEVRGFPALVDEGSTVGLQVLGSAAEQQAVHRLGCRRLLALGLPSPSRSLAESMSNADKLALAASPYPTVSDLLADCALAAVEQLMDRHGGPVWDEAAFEELRVAVGRELAETTRAVLGDVLRVLSSWRETDALLSGSADLPLLPALADMRGQLGRLVHTGFVADVGAEQLRQLPRYLSAVRLRREQLEAGLARDRQRMDQVASVQEAYLHRVGALPEGRPPGAGLVRVRWMLEELRVSLWTQQLGTAYPISQARVQKALDSL